MIRYRHTQIGYITIGALGVGLAVLGAQARVTGARPAVWGLIGAVLGVGSIFSRLTIEVTGSELRSRFGFGWPRKEVRLDRIESAVPVRNPWWYGWGIHWTPHGWLYNVSGLGGVEVRLRDGTRFRLGTDEPERLAAAITDARARI